MKIVNLGRYPTPAVRILVKYAADLMGVEELRCRPPLISVIGERQPAYVVSLTLKDTKFTFKGRCGGRHISVWLGAPDRFPRLGIQYPGLKTAPIHDLMDWQEALVCVAAHEFQHSRQICKRVRCSEVEADMRAVWALGEFRRERARLDAQVAEALARTGAAEAARAQKHAALRAPSRGKAQKLVDLEAKIKRWERKEKTAQTWLKKYRRQHRRLEGVIMKAAGAEPAQPEEAT